MVARRLWLALAFFALTTDGMARADAAPPPWTVADRGPVADAALSAASALDPRLQARTLLALSEVLADDGDMVRARAAAIAANDAPRPVGLLITPGIAAMLERSGDHDAALAVVRSAITPLERIQILNRLATEALRDSDRELFLSSVTAAVKARRELPFPSQHLEIRSWLLSLMSRDDVATVRALVRNLGEATDWQQIAGVARSSCHPGTPFATALAKRAEEVTHAAGPALAPSLFADPRVTAASEVVVVCDGLDAAKTLIHGLPHDSAAPVQLAVAGFLKVTDPAAYPVDSDDPVILARCAAALASIGATTALDDALIRAATLMSEVEPKPGWSTAMRAAYSDMHRDVAIGFANAGRPQAALAALQPIRGLPRLTALVRIVRSASEKRDDATIRIAVPEIISLVASDGSDLPGTQFQLRPLVNVLAGFPDQAAALSQALTATYGLQAAPMRVTVFPAGRNPALEPVTTAVRTLFPSLEAARAAVVLANNGKDDAAIAAALAIRPTPTEQALFDAIRNVATATPIAAMWFGLLANQPGGKPGFPLVGADTETTLSQSALLALDRVFLQRDDETAMIKVQAALPAGSASADKALALHGELLTRTDPRKAWGEAQTVKIPIARYGVMLAILKAPVVKP